MYSNYPGNQILKYSSQILNIPVSENYKGNFLNVELCNTIHIAMNPLIPMTLKWKISLRLTGLSPPVHSLM